MSTMPNSTGTSYRPLAVVAVVMLGLLSIIGSGGGGGSGGDSTPSVSPMPLPDTGQTGDYTETFGEDSDYTINPMSFTDNGDGTVTDNVTGLLWQKEDDGTTRTWENAEIYCADLTLSNHTDWRLPTEKELIRIVNYGGNSPSVDTAFPTTSVSFYWSSSTSPDNSSVACDVFFGNGACGTHNKSDSWFVRCVRGQSPTPTFTDNGNGTVTDKATGLMWQQGEGGLMTWESALTYCEEFTLAGYSDWRLPNVKELESITDDTMSGPALDTRYFPNVYSDLYWSSTTFAGDPSKAWCVSRCTVFSGRDKASIVTASPVRCVR